MNKKAPLQISVAIAAIVLMVVACNSDQATDTAEDTMKIDSIWADYEAGWESGDIDAWISLWTHDGIQMPPNEPPVIGRDRIRERNAAVLEQFAVNFDITNEEVGVGRDFAYSRGVYSATLTPKDGGQAIPLDGKFMTILMRQPDGSWKIHRDIFNSNVAPGGVD